MSRAGYARVHRRDHTFEIRRPVTDIFMMASPAGISFPGGEEYLLDGQPVSRERFMAAYTGRPALQIVPYDWSGG